MRVTETRKNGKKPCLARCPRIVVAFRVFNVQIIWDFEFLH
jgi:hypothetical protein